MEHLIKMNDLGGNTPIFGETPKYGSFHPNNQSKAVAFMKSILWSLCSSHPAGQSMACRLSFQSVHMAAQHGQTLTCFAGDVIMSLCLLWIAVWPTTGRNTGRSITVWWCVPPQAKIIHPSPASTRPWIFSMTRSASADVNGGLYVAWTVGPPSCSWIFVGFTSNTLWTPSDFIHLDPTMAMVCTIYLNMCTAYLYDINTGIPYVKTCLQNDAESWIKVYTVNVH